ncbi:hypothetical protein TOPH_05820 [Tolypocladium ophioglossoides CBS 100239]|uniref:Nucleoside phosphorylase domain-containing protein n=1 Tax=Tolypocladium ophioglossoides (strain CBS 100239) TaxID=1163406 RepID=A0A0L0N6M7_TOLOC|nr:hypothetical protein TOPH_05820 [Tolypocladium ophioglossoides CBS 100239]
MDKVPTTREGFVIAVICALPLEANAVSYVFDEFWDNEHHMQKATNDPNHYTHGRIGRHNAVLVLLPGIGKVHAAGAAAFLNASYPNLRLVLLVGICGGVPGHNILLGDVVISSSLVQFDFGRRFPGGTFLRKRSTGDTLGKLKKDLRSLLKNFETDRGRERLGQKSFENLKKLQATHADRMRGHQREKYKYPGTLQDKLFEANYHHKHRGTETCCTEDITCHAALMAPCEVVGCDESHLVLRQQLNLKRELEQRHLEEVQGPTIHVGPIASGDTRSEGYLQQDSILNASMRWCGCRHSRNCCSDPSRILDEYRSKFPCAVLLIDARGCLLPFHLETINSKEPNQVLQMGMVFRRRNDPSTQCPACGFVNAGLPDEQVQCRVCGLSYQRIKEIKTIHINRTQLPQDAAVGKRSDEIVSVGAPGPKQSKRQSSEEGIGRYKYVQLVIVDLTVQMVSDPCTVGTLRLSLDGSPEPKRVAADIAKLCGLPEEDCLTAAEAAIRAFCDTFEKSLERTKDIVRAKHESPMSARESALRPAVQLPKSRASRPAYATGLSPNSTSSSTLGTHSADNDEPEPQSTSHLTENIATLAGNLATVLMWTDGPREQVQKPQACTSPAPLTTVVEMPDNMWTCNFDGSRGMCWGKP